MSSEILTVSFQPLEFNLDDGATAIFSRDPRIAIAIPRLKIFDLTEGRRSGPSYLCSTENVCAISRSLNFWIFPLGVRGNSLRISSRSGQ